MYCLIDIIDNCHFTQHVSAYCFFFIINTTYILIFIFWVRLIIKIVYNSLISINKPSLAGTIPWTYWFSKLLTALLMSVSLDFITEMLLLFSFETAFIWSMPSLFHSDFELSIKKPLTGMSFAALKVMLTTFRVFKLATVTSWMNTKWIKNVFIMSIDVNNTRNTRF